MGRMSVKHSVFLSHDRIQQRRAAIGKPLHDLAYRTRLSASGIAAVIKRISRQQPVSYDVAMQLLVMLECSDIRQLQGPDADAAAMWYYKQKPVDNVNTKLYAQMIEKQNKNRTEKIAALKRGKRILIDLRGYVDER